MTTGSKTTARFAVTSPSRHPAGLKGYDAGRARYRPEYVNPPAWKLQLAFLPPGLTGLTRRDHRKGHENDSQAKGEGKPTLPAAIASYQWQVRQVGGTFSTSQRINRTEYLIWNEVSVPRPGNYEVTLRVNLADGTRESRTRVFRLRDLLVVGIGDSFASGQGNPDRPAVPSVDQKLMCKTTTLRMVIDRAAQFLSDLTGKPRELMEKMLGAMPFVGKIAAEGLNLMHDVEDLFGDLGDDVVDLARIGANVVEEGFEEAVHWLGIGDGGESEEIRSGPAVWQEPRAYRSYLSGQSLAARQLERGSAFGADRVTFLSFARTGSEIDSGLLGPRTVKDTFKVVHSIDGWTDNRGQVAEAAQAVDGRRIDALVISVGINDIGFSSLVTDAVLMASGEKRKKRVADATKRVLEEYPRQLDELRTAITRELRPRHVFITQYPVNVFQEIADGGEPCGVLGSSVPNPATGKGLDLDGPDARDYGRLGRLLNEQIRVKAEEFGWTLVDGIAEGFAGHGYCARKPYFVSAEESCLNQGDFEGMLHPNRPGHAVAKDRIAQTVRSRLLAADWLESALHVVMH